MFDRERTSRLPGSARLPRTTQPHQAQVQGQEEAQPQGSGTRSKTKAEREQAQEQTHRQGQRQENKAHGQEPLESATKPETFGGKGKLDPGGVDVRLVFAESLIALLSEEP